MSYGNDGALRIMSPRTQQIIERTMRIPVILYEVLSAPFIGRTYVVKEKPHKSGIECATMAGEKTDSLQRVPLIGGKQHLIRMGTSLQQPHFSRCCRLLHVRTLAIIIAVVELFYLIYQGLLATSLYLSSSSDEHTISIMLYTMVVVLAVLAVILQLTGIARHTPTLLIPHLLMQILFILTLFVLSLFAMYSLLVGTYITLDVTLEGIPEYVSVEVSPALPKIPIPPIEAALISKLLIGTLVLIAIGYALLAMINIWCFHVVLDCYRWLLFRLAEKSSVLGDSPLPTVHDPIIADVNGKAHSDGARV